MSSPPISPPPPPSDGDSACTGSGDPVRQRILEAAIEQFAERGFDGTSTRAIAQAAEAAMSSITYQFGGKEGLYLAAADHIACQIADFIQPRIDAARAGVDSGTLEPVEAIIAILSGMVELMLDESSGTWSGFIIREQQEPSEAFEHIFSGVMQPMADVINELAGRVRTDLKGQHLRAVCMGMVGQVIALRAARASMLRIMEFDELGAGERAILRDAIAANARAILQVKG